jgi:phosphoribosyl 1,2-cyclic phosphate phosphodiesterase
MRLHFLGTGTSFGIPVMGCPCETCHSGDPHDRRTRHAALLERDGKRVLIDTPPELRLQLVGARVMDIDAVWFTHHHADHTHGVDDLRAFSMRTGEPITVYGSSECLAKIGGKFDYVFNSLLRPQDGTTIPEARMHELTPYEEIEIAGFRLTPLPVPHGNVEVLGFRVGELGYITDAKRLPPRTFQGLAGVRVLVLNALWYGRPHPTHFSVEEAVAAAEAVGAERTFLTHLSHRVGHAELERRLPPGVRPAYDGLEVEV